MELQDRTEELAEQGLGVAAISYDPVEVLADFADRRGITYPLLSDEGSETIREYGILNTVVAEALGPRADDPAVQADAAKYVSAFGVPPFMTGIPFPGTFIVDRDGRVTARFFEDFYQERSTASRIMLRLGTDASPASGVEGSTPHLSVRATQSDPEVSPGSLFTLLLEVTPNENIHVYAPGAEELGYRVIGLELADTPAIQVGELRYPESEIYHFEPLDEHVPVFQEPFTLRQDVTLGFDRAAREAIGSEGVVTLTGSLHYQACDDAVCFTPVSVPLTWSVAVKPLDLERANVER